jgi:periplasmic divalent cation tolerance protein
MTPEFVELVLTCGSWQEAQAIADAVLQKHLVACVEMLEIKSKYWWEGKLAEATEIKLVMESVAQNFESVEAEVIKLHSYDTFVLQQLPLTNLSSDAAAWWVEQTRGNA